MDNINEIQKEFFETLSSIQENAIYQALEKYDKNDSLEDLLYNTTYEAITSICELLDGYTSDRLQFDLIDKNSNKSLKTGIQMHDVCAGYLKWKNPKNINSISIECTPKSIEKK